jgi:hypothetical protein
MAIERRFSHQASTIKILASSPWRKPVILGGLSSFVGDCSKVNDCEKYLEDRQHERPPEAVAPSLGPVTVT